MANEHRWDAISFADMSETIVTTYLKWALVAVWFASGAAAASIGAPSANASRPNVVFILADDLGWGDLGIYGHPTLKTKNLDRLARQGAMFTQFYVCSGVCSPSRTAFMTSHFPARHRIHNFLSRPSDNAKWGMPNFLDPNVVTVAKLLKKAGYVTGHFGKWHLSGSDPKAPEPGAYGFDAYRSYNGTGPGFDESDPYFRAKSTDLIVDETIHFIEKNRDKPFYVHTWLLLPHSILNPTDEQLAVYKNFAPHNVPYHGTRKVYSASVTAIDQALGRLFKRLDELGLAENTIVIFSSDNGPENIYNQNASHSGIGSPGPFRGCKRSLYEGGIRVPFIVRWPAKIPAGHLDETTVMCGIDYLPTLCALLGANVPEDLAPDGQDMSAAWRGTPQRRDRPLMWDMRFRVTGHVIHRSPMLAIRDGQWKLLMNPDRSRLELFDIVADPSEMKNVADFHPDIVDRLAKKILTWRATVPLSLIHI